MPCASGRFVLRISPELHEKLRRAAAREECSLNELCARLLRKGLLTADGGGGQGVARIASEIVPDALLDRTARVLGDELEGVVLFGSAARAEMWDTSDVDLLLVLRQHATVSRELYERWDTEIAGRSAPFSHTISPHFATLPGDVRNVGGLWLEIALHGVVLWDPYLRVAKFLSRLRQEIAAGAVVRRLVHGQPYWVRAETTS